MPRLAHISDLHFGRITQNAAHFLLDDLTEMAPDYLLVTGDITQSARRREFEEAGAFFAQAPGEVFVVPGNHDIPGWAFWRRLLRPYGRYKRYVSEDVNPVHITDDIALVGFNTARRVVYHWNWANGRISYSQFDTLREVARQAKGRPKVAMFHHPLVPPPADVSQKRVGRAEEFALALSEADFHIALSGHLHKSRVVRVCEMYPAAAGNLYAVEAGTATSSRLRNEPNEYNVIDIESGSAEVQIRSFDGQRFQTRLTTPIRFG